MQMLLRTIDTTDFWVIAAVNLDQLAFPSVISCLHFAAATTANSRNTALIVNAWVMIG